MVKKKTRCKGVGRRARCEYKKGEGSEKLAPMAYMSYSPPQQYNNIHYLLALTYQSYPFLMPIRL